MTTGRINQVACRAPSPARTAHKARPESRARNPQRHRPSDARAAPTSAPTRGNQSEVNRADAPGCSTCVRSVNGVGVAHAPTRCVVRRVRRLQRAAPSIKRRGGAPRRKERPLFPAGTRWSRAAHSVRDDWSTHQGEPNRTMETLVKRAPIARGLRRGGTPSRLRPHERPWCAGPPAARPIAGARGGRPLHALACTRRLRRVAKPFTQPKMPWHEPRGPPLRQFEGGRRRVGDPAAAMPRHRATRCRAPRASRCRGRRAGARPRL